MEKQKIYTVYGLRPMSDCNNRYRMINHTDFVCPFCGGKFEYASAEMPAYPNYMDRIGSVNRNLRMYSEIIHDNITIKCVTCGIEISNMKSDLVSIYDESEIDTNDIITEKSTNSISFIDSIKYINDKHLQ